MSGLQSRLAKVQTCFTLVKDDLDASPICPHCLKGKKLPVKIRNDLVQGMQQALSGLICGAVGLAS